jgi:plastocyanin
MNRKLAYSAQSIARRVFPVVLLMGILAVAALMTACGGASDTTTSTISAPTGVTGAQVVMKDIAFDPVSVTISAGETVTWTNEDSVTHTAVGDNGEFESGDMANGDTFSFTFDQAGTYPYHCSIHPSMTGTVVVQ